MKSAAGTSSATAPQKGQVDLQEIALQVLKTYILLEKPFGAGYVARLLRGDGLQYIKSDEHLKLETVGTIGGFSVVELRYAIQRIMEKGFLEGADKNLFRLRITSKGRDYLDQPMPMIVSWKEIRLSGEERFVQRALLDYRKKSSGDHKVPPYRIFNDMTMDYLVKELPVEQTHLLGIGNLNEFNVKKYGSEIVKAIQKGRNQYLGIQQMGLERRIQHETHQRVYRLHNEGKSPEEIAGTLGIKKSTVLSYLMNFHMAGIHDMRSFIENSIDGQDLFRCTEFFRRTVDAALSDAVNALGIDYSTARMAYTYMTDFQARPETVAA